MVVLSDSCFSNLLKINVIRGEKFRTSLRFAQKHQK